MKMKCPHCGVSGKAAGNLSGRKVKCPKCYNYFLVPMIEKTESVAIDSNLTVLNDSENEIASTEVTEVTDHDTQQEELNEHVLENSPEQSELVKDREDEVEGLEPEILQEADDHDEENVGAEGLDSVLSEEIDTEDLLENRLEESDPDELVDSFASLPTSADNEVTEEEDYAGQDDIPAASAEEEQSPVQDIQLGDDHEVDDFPDFSSDNVDWENDPEKTTSVPVLSGEVPPETVEEELQAELDAMLAGTCSVCGKTADDENSFNEEDRLYCKDCFSKTSDSVIAEQQDKIEESVSVSQESPAQDMNERSVKVPPFFYEGDFTVSGIIKEAWRMTKGIKGSIWAGIVAMFVILFGFGGLTVMFLPSAGAPAGGTVTAWIYIIIQLLGTILSMVFTAGLMYIGVQRVAGKTFSWKMIFSGFTKLSSIALSGILMTLLISSGFFLLILPGIYLAVGYSLTLPLIIDKGLGPWDAMEVSRKSVHQKWWQVFGVYLVMYLIHLISCIPLGLGMIWTVPMFFTVSGVMYRLMFQEEVR